VQGLAFAYSAAYLVTAVIAFAALRRRVGRLEGRRLATSTGKMAVAAAVMGLVAWLATRSIGAPAGSGAIVRLFVGVLTGVVVYGVGVVLLRVEEVRGLLDRLHR
jgi:putative peptidoglycan lipid II flippase